MSTLTAPTLTKLPAAIVGKVYTPVILENGNIQLWLNGKMYTFRQIGSVGNDDILTCLDTGEPARVTWIAHPQPGQPKQVRFGGVV